MAFLTKVHKWLGHEDNASTQTSFQMILVPVFVDVRLSVGAPPVPVVNFICLASAVESIDSLAPRIDAIMHIEV